MAAPDIDIWLNRAILRLARAGVDTPNLDAVLLFCKVAGCTRTQWIARSYLPLEPAQFADLESLLVRREEREPLPHLLGEWEFMGHTYEVGPQALIPRPETELLVEAVVERLRSGDGAALQGSLGERGLTPQPPSLPGKGEPDDAVGCASDLPSPGAGGEARVPLQLLDVGTGTGCIAIELALRLPSALVTTLDLSSEALDLARRNVARFNLEERVTLRRAKFPNDVGGWGPFDAIVSNPPYIPSEEVDRLAPELVRYEPRAALDGGADGLDVIRSLVFESGPLLNPGGLLAMEIGYDQRGDVIALLRSAGWSDLEIVPDLAGIDRVVLAQTPL